MTSESEDEWVRGKSAEFEHFPLLTIDSDITEFDFSGVFDERPTVQCSQTRQLEATHFTLIEPVGPPSASLPPPSLPQQGAPAPRPAPVERTERPMPIAPRPPPVHHAPVEKKKQKDMFDLDELQASHEYEWRLTQERRSEVSDER
jgi:hypothetical protein